MADRTAQREQTTVDRATLTRLVSVQRHRQRRDLRAFTRRLGMLLSVLVVILIGGSVALAVDEGTSFGYGFLWTVDLITTLGTVPLPSDTLGRVIVVVVALGGVGTLFYGFATIAEFFVSGQLSGMVSLRRTQRMIDSYSDHYIVCGYGRVGRQVARDLKAYGANVVVVDQNPLHRETAEGDDVAWIEGQATEDEVLARAGIERAVAVIACLDSDSDNIVIALSARELRGDILIIARASADDAEKKLHRAGADRVISPYKTTGSEMARMALRPQVGGAVSIADYRVEQIEVLAGSAGVGQTVADVRGQSVIVALRRSDGRLETQPPPKAVISAGDTLIVLGTSPALDTLERLFQPSMVPSA
jgi:voltage-gated potassium channel